MTIEIFDVIDDKVIGSLVAYGKTNYRFSLDHLFPLTNRFDAQRKIQARKFYKRLERDIIDGCVMPAITIAFVEENIQNLVKENIKEYINENIGNGYILDGIQRLNALNRVSQEEGFDDTLTLYLNVIIAPSEDRLVYRMITLNNGQKPMTPRHQIEILTKGFFDSSDYNIQIQTEKEKAEKLIVGSFNFGDVSRAYLSFLTNEVHNENNKIIGEKMDEIIVGRIMDVKPESLDFDFKDVMNLIERFTEDAYVKKWFKVSNNLIGFSVGVKKSYLIISNTETESFSRSLSLFDDAFKAINPSKVNLGRYRRELSKVFIERYAEFSELDVDGLIEEFAEITA